MISKRISWLLGLFLLSPVAVRADFSCDGVMISFRALNLLCGNLFSGDGYLSAPDIHIETKKFAFTGTIDCSGTCEILAEEPFDANMFTQQGGGKLIINGTEQGWGKYWSWLCNSSKSRNIVLGCLAITAITGAGYYLWSKYKKHKEPVQQPVCA